MNSNDKFWARQISAHPTIKRQLTKLQKHTELVRIEGAGFLLRVTKDMLVFKRGLFYYPAPKTSFCYGVNAKSAMIALKIPVGANIFFCPDQIYRTNEVRTLKLRASTVKTISVYNLEVPDQKLGFAVSSYRRDNTGEQTTYIPDRTIHTRMSNFTNECGAGLHFYLFKSEVNKIYKI